MFWIAALALIVAACVGGAPSPSASRTPSPPVATPASAAPSGSTPLGPTGSVAWSSPNAGTREITNHTDRTNYFSVSRWRMEQFDVCAGWGEQNIQTGPVALGETAWVTNFGNPEPGNARITLAFWGEPCGEGCQREPVVAMPVGLSPIAPGMS